MGGVGVGQVSNAPPLQAHQQWSPMQGGGFGSAGQGGDASIEAEDELAEAARACRLVLGRLELPPRCAWRHDGQSCPSATLAAMYCMCSIGMHAHAYGWWTTVSAGHGPLPRLAGNPAKPAQPLQVPAGLPRGPGPLQRQGVVQGAGAGKRSGGRSRSP